MTDPHIHVGRKLGAELAGRERLAAMFGLVADSPATVATGCGVQVPPVMTSIQPERVTCLACREFAHRELLRLAGQVGELGVSPGSPLRPGTVHDAMRAYRELARRFAEP